MGSVVLEVVVVVVGSDKNGWSVEVVSERSLGSNAKGCKPQTWMDAYVLSKNIQDEKFRVAILS